MRALGCPPFLVLQSRIMPSGKEANYHFKQVVEGLPQEVMPLIGQSLQSLAEKRDGHEVDFVAQLNEALLKLSVGLLESKGGNLNPQQRLALCSGLFGDTIELKSKSGERVVIELVPSDRYEQMLKEMEEESQSVDFLLYPLNRIRTLATGALKPFDLDHPGRYREPKKPKGTPISPEKIQADWLAALDNLRGSNKQLSVSKHDLLNVYSSTRIGGALNTVTEHEKLANTALKALPNIKQVQEMDPENLFSMQGMDIALSNFKKFSDDTGQVLEQLITTLQGQHQALKNFQNCSGALQSSVGPVEKMKPQAVTLKPEDAKTVLADMKAINKVMDQLLKQSTKKSQFLFTRMLLTEQTEDAADPGTNCYASPANLIASIKKINGINPNCFPQDSVGMPIMPPVIIEPGVGVVSWLTDRFLLGFVSNETPRKGPKVSFSPLDVSVMTMFGLFLARGELFDYRGNRISGNFMADYSSQIESKAVAKFAGKAKKLTYTTITQEKDAASRGDAVRDYLDFLYHVMNGLPIPKKISPRKVSVFLRYCIIKTARFTAGLVLQFVHNFDELVAREILTNLGEKNQAKIVTLLQQVMEDVPIIANKFRHDIETTLVEVMGRDFATDAKNSGLLEPGGEAVQPVPKPGNGEADPDADTQHDFFDL